MKVLKWIGIGLATLVGCVLLVALIARFGDGPLGPFPGGALEAGEWVDPTPTDWSFAADLREMDLQLEEPASSRRTWLVVRDGVLYVPCGLPNQLKRWPHQAQKDGRAIMRLDGKLYRVQLTQITEPTLHTAVAQDSSRKYGFEVPEKADPETVWYFAVGPRKT